MGDWRGRQGASEQGEDAMDVEITPEELEQVLQAARARNPEMADKVKRQRDRGILTYGEYVMKLAEVAGWV